MVITCVENWRRYNREIVGGKGFNLMRLYEASKQLGTFTVPEFFVIPPTCEKFDSREIREEFDKLPKPVAVRSSSPLEDGENATFAGRFETCLDINDYDGLVAAAELVRLSAQGDKAKQYAQKMRLQLTEKMAIIVQRQIVNPLEKGIIQLNDFSATTELTIPNGETRGGGV